MLPKCNSFGVVIWLLVGSITFYKSTLVLAKNELKKNATGARTPIAKNVLPSTGSTTIDKSNQFIRKTTNGNNQTALQQNGNRVVNSNQSNKPTAGAAGDGGQPSGTAASDGGQPSGNAASDGGQPSGTAAGDGGQPSGTAASDGGQPSGTAAGDGGQPSGTAAGDGGQPSGTAAGDVGQPSGTAASDVGQPSGTAASDGGQPSGTAANNKGQPSGTAAGDGGQPSGTAANNKGQPSGTAANNKGQPSGTAASDGGQPSGTAASDGGQPSGTAASDGGQPSGTAAGDGGQPSGTAASDGGQPSGSAANNKSQPSGTAASGKSQPSGTAANNNIVHNAIQQSGSKVVSISDVLPQTSQSTTINKAYKKPVATDEVVAQTTALDIHTTTEVSFKSDINIAAKPAVEDGHFMMYLILGLLLLSVVYITYHNKSKIISLCQKGGPKRTRRPKTSEYQRLDQNLSEVITSLKKKSNFKMS
ncbi:protein SPT2 homolog [Mobula hypostoma]|uniref:protein SPT2 homolog n=1 Tax=Mobula hypostoma TaxID=723540 RepID=UPI002FC2B16A